MSMHICDIVKYGEFDSAVMFPGQKVTASRTAIHFEMEYILSGGGVAYIDGHTCAHAAGMVILRKPGQSSHSLLPFKCLYVHFDISESSEFYSLLTGTPAFFQIIDSRRYKRSFTELLAHLSMPDTDPSDSFVAAKFLELFHYMKTDAPKNRQFLQMYERPHPSPIVNAMEYMRDNLHEKISMERLGEISGYSPNYFQNLFHKLNRVTPQKYLLYLRLGKAKQLLCGAEYSLSEIAQLCGFSSQSYFGAVFKKEIGLTPKEFRRRSFARYLNTK